MAGRHGLVTPVIRDAARLRLSEIAASVRSLSARAERREPEDPRDGTFTVSSLGMPGVDWFAAVIDAPQAGTLAVGAMRAATFVVDARVETGTALSLTLTADQRVTDGAEAGRFLAEVKRLIEDPRRLLL